MQLLRYILLVLSTTAATIAGPLAYGICQAGCSALVVACYVVLLDSPLAPWRPPPLLQRLSPATRHMGLVRLPVLHPSWLLSHRYLYPLSRGYKDLCCSLADMVLWNLGRNEGRSDRLSYGSRGQMGYNRRTNAS